MVKTIDKRKWKDTMITIRDFLLVCVFLFSSVYAYAGNEGLDYKFNIPAGMTINEAVEKGEIEIPPGMEIMQLGTNSAIIVPKGSLMHKAGGHTYIESIQQYVGRNFETMNNQLNKIAATQEELKKKMDLLNASLTEMQKSINLPVKNETKSQ